MNRRNALVLLVYALLTLVLTYPLVTQMADHVPGTATWSMDEYGYVWNNWWFKFAVLDQGVNPFRTDYLFYPLGTSLVLYAYTLLHVALALPLQLAVGLIPAVNSTVLFSFVASAFGMYLFASYFLRVSLTTWRDQSGGRIGLWADDDNLRALAAFVAGVVFAFTSNRYVYVSLGHYNIVASEWLPFYLLFFFKVLLEPHWKNALLAGLFAAFALYTETTDGVLIALLSAVILLFEWRRLNRHSLGRLGVAVCVAALLFAPLLIPTLGEIFASGYSLPGWGHSEKLLVDLNGFFSPTSLSPLNRFWEQELDQVREGIARFSDINTFFVGYATALFALVGLTRFWRRTRLWLAVVVVFAILAMGPLLHINGRSEFDLDGLTTTIPLPFLILHYIPLIKENRVPNRYSILVAIGLAVLIAYAVWWVAGLVFEFLRRRGRGERAALLGSGAIVALLAGLLIFEHLALPLPLTDARVPDAYAQIAREPGKFTVLSLPLGWRNSFGQVGAEDTRTQYYQAISEKYLLTGQIQRNAPFLFDYFARAPILRSIIQLETYNNIGDDWTADREAADEFVRFFDIRYVVVNAPVPGRVPWSDTYQNTLKFVQSVLPLGNVIYQQGGTIAYAVNQPAFPAKQRIDFGTDKARLYQGAGWTADESVGGATANWASQQDAELFIPARDLRDATLTVRALPFEYSGHTQSMLLFVNGRASGNVELSPGWNDYSFKIDHAVLHEGINELRFRFGYVVKPSDVLPANYAIGGTGVVSPVDIAAQSTSQFASIKVNGREVSPLKRGYNLAVIDPRTGAVLDVRNFDTGGESIEESRALTDFVKKIRDGAIVVGAVQEEGATMLREGSAAALESLGLADLRGTEGQTQAFIVVKGAPGGLEATGGGPSAVGVGHNTDTRTLSVAFDWVRFEWGTVQ